MSYYYEPSHLAGSAVFANSAIIVFGASRVKYLNNIYTLQCIPTHLLQTQQLLFSERSKKGTDQTARSLVPGFT